MAGNNNPKYLTPDIIAKEAMAIFHQKAVLLPKLNTDYDKYFAKVGQKIGKKLRIERPMKFLVREGEIMETNDIEQLSDEFTVATLRGVDLEFSTTDLTMTIDNFKTKFLDKAMMRLVTAVESDLMRMILQVPAVVNNLTSKLTYDAVLEAGQILDEALVPTDRTAILTPKDRKNLIIDTKTLFNNSTEIGKQYKTGRMGESMGVEFFESTLLRAYTSGVAASATTYNTGVAVTANGSTSVTCTAAAPANAFRRGDSITFAGVTALHPEELNDTGILKPFVVTEDYVGGAAPGNTIKFLPAIYTSGPYQNVPAAGIPNSAAITKLGGANAVLRPSVIFAKDAFSVVSAKMEIDKAMAWASSVYHDGIGIRVWRGSDIRTNRILNRLDVLYGYKTLNPEYAVRIHSL